MNAEQLLIEATAPHNFDYPAPTVTRKFQNHIHAWVDAGRPKVITPKSGLDDLLLAAGINLDYFKSGTIKRAPARHVFACLLRKIKREIRS